MLFYFTPVGYLFSLIKQGRHNMDIWAGTQFSTYVVFFNQHIKSICNWFHSYLHLISFDIYFILCSSFSCWTTLVPVQFSPFSLLLRPMSFIRAAYRSMGKCYLQAHGHLPHQRLHYWRKCCSFFQQTLIFSKFTEWQKTCEPLTSVTGYWWTQSYIGLVKRPPECISHIMPKKTSCIFKQWLCTNLY